MHFTDQQALMEYLSFLQQQREVQADVTLAPPFSSSLSREKLRLLMSICLPMAQERTESLRRERNGAWRVQVRWRYRMGVETADTWLRGGKLTPLQQLLFQRAQELIQDLPGTTDAERIFHLTKRLHSLAEYDDPPLGTKEHRRAVDAASVLLYGRGNCQAFADAFYLLAVLCGFRANLRCGWKNRILHLWNEVDLPGGGLTVDAAEGSVKASS